MRIAIDVRPLIEPFPSGVSAYTYHLCQSLCTHYPEHEYVLFCNAATGVPPAVRTLADHTSVILVHGSTPNKLFNSSLVIRRRPYLDQLVGGADVFFMPNINFAAFSPSMPLVITAHDISFFHPEFYPLKARLWHRMIRPGKQYSRANAIIAVSQSTKRDLMERYHIPDEQIHVIYHGVDFDRFSTVPDEERDRIIHQYKLKKPYALFLGNVEDRKNIMGLADAWQRVYQKNLSYNLVIAGNQNSVALPWHPGVRQLGYIPEDDKAALYAGAALFVYPSLYEGFGLPLLEAMAAGVPVITSFSTALAEVAGEAALTVDPYNVRELARVIHQVLDDKRLRTQMVARGRERARQFTWRRTADQTMAVFSSLYNSSL